MAFETAQDLWIEREQVATEKKDQVGPRTPSSHVAHPHEIGLKIDERFNDAGEDHQHNEKQFPLQPGEFVQNNGDQVRLLQVAEE